MYNAKVSDPAVVILCCLRSVQHRGACVEEPAYRLQAALREKLQSLVAKARVKVRAPTDVVSLVFVCFTCSSDTSSVVVSISLSNMRLSCLESAT